MAIKASSARRTYHFILARVALVMVLAPLAASAATAECVSLWSANGSTVCLIADGDRRMLRYEEPRPAMREEGVERGTLLFEGRLDGSALTGTAYVFSGRCGRAFPYPVSGQMEPDSRSIILRGQPVSRLSRDCRVLARRDDEQRIELVQALEPRRAPAVVVSPTADEAAQRRFSKFLAELQSCQLGDLKACDAASRYEQVTPEDRLRIAEMRAAVVATAAETARKDREIQQRLDQERREREDQLAREAQTRARRTLETDTRLCVAGDRAACAAALASPILGIADKARLERRVTDLDARPIQPPARQLQADPPPATQLASLVSVPPALILDWLAPVLGLGLLALLIMLGWKWCKTPAPKAVRTSEAAEPSMEPRMHHANPPPTATAPRVPPPPAPPSTPPDMAPPAVAPVPPPRPQRSRDTPAALAAMQLAFAYLEEVRQAPSPDFEDTAERKQQLNTLSLAAKRLEAATAHDPDAVLETMDDHNNPIHFTINELKAKVLLTEGLTHQVYDVKRALTALTAATEHDPQNAVAFYILGLAHAENRNKALAIEALQRAVELDPSDIDYRKELDRIENLSAAAVAAYKVTRAGEKIYGAGIKAANVGIRIYNVFVVLWNIFAITWNVVTFPIRLMARIGRA